MRKNFKGFIGLAMAAESLGLCLFVLLAVFGRNAIAEKLQVVKPRPPRTAFSGISIFDNKLNAKDFFGTKLVHLSNPSEQTAPPPEEQKQSSPAEAPEEQAKLRPANIEYWSDDPRQQPEIRPPQQNPSVRVNPEAPNSIKGMISAMRDGDNTMAGAYADEYVNYLQNYFFEIREITQLIGEALIRQGAIDEDDWVGVPQMFSYEMAKTNKELGSVLAATQDVAMKRIKPDLKNQAEIYYFFTLNCSWCRYMAPDVERLYRMVKDDAKVKLTVLTLGPAREDFLREYRSYTGLSMPIYDGGELAKQLNLAYVPAVIIVSPNGNTAYLKSGQQTFESMYQFVRTVQGLPATVTDQFLALEKVKIGEVELLQANGTSAGIHIASGTTGNSSVVSDSRSQRVKYSVERF